MQNLPMVDGFSLSPLTNHLSCFSEIFALNSNPQPTPQYGHKESTFLSGLTFLVPLSSNKLD